MSLSRSQKFLAAAATSALLSGCGYNGAGSAGPSLGSNFAPAGSIVRGLSGAQGSVDSSGSRVAYISSVNGPPGSGQVLVFPAGLKAHNPAPIRTITSGTARPQGMWVDSAGTLYVVNIPQGAPTTGVSEYHPGSLTPFRFLRDQLTFPTEVAVAADGTVYVNQRQGQNGLGEFVTVFPPGSIHASRTIDLHFSGYALEADQMAFDKNGDLLVSAFTFRSGLHIFSITPGTFQFRELPLNVRGLSGPGLAVDGAGNIYVSSFTSGQIAVFAPGSNNPSRVINQGAEDLTVLSDGTLYAATGDGINEYKPGGSSPVNNITAPVGNFGFGIAVGPAQ